jgi:glutaredoxin
MNEVIELEKDNIESYMSHKHLVVVYSMKGCKACVKIKPTLYELDPKYKVVIADVIKYPRSTRFSKTPNMMSLPTVILFEKGYYVKELFTQDLIEMKN